VVMILKELSKNKKSDLLVGKWLLKGSAINTMSN
jgi:hypothetical protein